MLDHKGFDLWAEGYDRSVNLSDDDNTYPFGGYKRVLARIYEQVRQGSGTRVLGYQDRKNLVLKSKWL